MGYIEEWHNKELLAKNMMQLDLAEKIFPDDSIDEGMKRWADEGYAQKFNTVIDKHPEILEGFLKSPEDAKDEIEALMRGM